MKYSMDRARQQNDPRSRKQIIEDRVTQFEQELRHDRDIPDSDKEILLNKYKEGLEKAPTLTKNYPCDREKSDFQQMKQNLKMKHHIQEVTSIGTLEYPNSELDPFDNPLPHPPED